MSEIKVEKHVMGMYMANCYLLNKGNHVLLIDPGATSRSLVAHIQEMGVTVDGILLTHGHFDHIGGVDYFVNAFHCPVFIDEEDKGMLKDTRLNGSIKGREGIVETSVHYYNANMNTVGTFDFETIFAPGHTHGCTMLKFDDLLFTGDVLFKETIGRTDLPVSSNNKMKQTLELIKTLEPSLIVYPGHGEDSTLLHELKFNPYLQ